MREANDRWNAHQEASREALGKEREHLAPRAEKAGQNMVFMFDFVKGHQELNLKPRSEDRNFANAPEIALQLYYYTLLAEISCRVPLYNSQPLMHHVYTACPIS
jgi:hypothetical protein